MDTRFVSDAESHEIADGVVLTPLVFGERMSVQHVRVEPGGRVPEHDHPHEQTGYVTRGELVFESGSEEQTLSEGASYAIPGDQPHAVENRTEETAVAIDVFSPPREDSPWD
ncbi:MAG: cupin domain-containing protein [Halobacteriaceae archaeon]